jgi:Ca-activated chloride channel homolog
MPTSPQQVFGADGAFRFDWYCRTMRTTLLIVVVALLSSIGIAPADPKPTSNGALVLVIDRSGSMQGAKLTAAKEAAKAAVSNMNPNDYVAVVAFDSEAIVMVRPQRAADRVKINKDIDRLTAGGGTNIFPGLKEAYEILQNLAAPKKHVILLSDGEAPTEGISDLIKTMRKDKQTISTVGVPGADDTLLQKISDEGGGRMHKVTDLKTLSEVYIKELKDAKLATK